MNPAVQHSCFTSIDLEDIVVVTKGSIKFFLTVAPLQASSWLALLVKVFASLFLPSMSRTEIIEGQRELHPGRMLEILLVVQLHSRVLSSLL